jgi:hypothetical protein
MSFVYKAYEVDIRRSDPSEPPRTINNTEELVGKKCASTYGHFVHVLLHFWSWA